MYPFLLTEQSRGLPAPPGRCGAAPGDEIIWAAAAFTPRLV